jgi:hypothetical protein
VIGISKINGLYITRRQKKGQFNNLLIFTFYDMCSKYSTCSETNKSALRE